MENVKIADFTEYDVLLEGEWTDYFGQSRFVGRLSSETGICAVSFVTGEEGFWYSKSNRSKTGVLDIDLLIHGLRDADFFQIILRIGRGTNYKASFSKQRRVDIANKLRFKTGHIIDLAKPDDFGDTIKLLVLSNEDVKPKRAGIWTVKRRYLHNVFEPWLALLTKTRRGYIKMSEP